MQEPHQPEQRLAALKALAPGLLRSSSSRSLFRRPRGSAGELPGARGNDAQASSDAVRAPFARGARGPALSGFAPALAAGLYFRSFDLSHNPEVVWLPA